MRVILLICAHLFALTASADKWTFTVKKDGAATKISSADLSATDENQFLGDQDVELEFTCEDNLDCRKLEVTTKHGTAAAKAQPLTNQTTTGAKGKIPKGDLPEGTTNLTVTLKGTPPAADVPQQFTIKREVAQPAVPAADPIPVTLQELLRAPCVRPPLDTIETYDEENNKAVFVIDALGNVLRAPDDTVDENDNVTVQLIAPPQAAPLLSVKRRSATRALGVFNAIGAGLTITIPEDQRPQQSRGPKAPRPPDCIVTNYELSDFAPGNGVIEVSAFVDEQRAVINTIEFAVSRLYEGIYGLGVITSDLTDRTFTLVPHDDDQVIAEEQEGETTRYVVTYTPYIWGRRDLDKRRGWREELRSRWWHHINPIVGVTLNDVGDNAIVGASLDVGPFLVSYGFHFSNVHVLSSRSGLKPGDPFTGAAADLPVVTKWENDPFIGFSLDLRAAVQLLSTLGSAASP